MRSALQRCGSSLLRTSPLTVRSSIRSRHSIVAIERLPITIKHSTARQLHFSQRLSQEPEQAEAEEETSSSGDNGVITKFQDLGTQNLVHQSIVRELTQGMGLESMTEVQIKTLNQALKGLDIIAQAKTGTGKTLAFLIPILQNIISNDPHLAERGRGYRGPRADASDIRALIISPTRELAEQIAVEAKRVTRGTGIVVQCAVGGTQKSAGLRAIQREGCHLLVGTPGRLQDILTDEYTRVQAPDLSALVLDEADRLMDQGFWPDIQQIIALLPNRAEKDRQTLLFSATVPKDVVQLVRSTLKPGFDFVQCVNENDEPTHERVAQHIVVTKGFENNVPTLVELITREIEKQNQPGKTPFKAIVYHNSAAECGLVNSALQGLQRKDDQAAAPSSSSSSFFRNDHRLHPWPNVEVSEIHSRLSQQQRTRTADRFRRATSGVLISSDVTARGLDFPDVTHVIQIGAPTSREQYIHRIGRTARAGKEGQGWVIATELELPLARSRIGNLPIKRHNDLEVPQLDLTQELQVSAQAGNVLSMVQNSFRSIPGMEKAKVFKATLGTLQSIGDKRGIVQSMNNLAKYGWGMQQPPAVSHGLAAKLGLSRIPGLNVGHDEYVDESRGSGGNFGRQSFGGRDQGGSSFGGQRGGSRDGFGSRDGSRGGGGGGGFGSSFRQDRGGSRDGYRGRDSGSRSTF